MGMWYDNKNGEFVRATKVRSVIIDKTDSVLIRLTLNPYNEMAKTTFSA